MTDAEKIQFLNKAVTALHKNIYVACLECKFDLEELDIENYNSEEFLSLFPQNLNPSAFMAKNSIDRNVKKLIAIKNKLDELNNA
jgi:hypothetical protein